jgi:hypothetical protein
MSDDWELVYDDGLVAKWERDLNEHQTEVRTVCYAAPAFYGINEALRNESEGKPFGDGQVVASFPMSVWADQLAQPIREGDDAYVRRFLNDVDNRAYRTFRGKV